MDQILDENRGRKARLFLVQMDRSELEPDGRPDLELSQKREERIGILTAG